MGRHYPNTKPFVYGKDDPAARRLEASSKRKKQTILYMRLLSALVMLLGVAMGAYGLTLLTKNVDVGDCTLLPDSASCTWQHDDWSETNIPRLQYTKAAFYSHSGGSGEESSTCTVHWAYEDLKDEKRLQACQDLIARQGTNLHPGAGPVTRLCSRERGGNSQDRCVEGSEKAFRMKAMFPLVFGALFFLAPPLVCCLVPLCRRLGGGATHGDGMQVPPASKGLGKDPKEEQQGGQQQSLAADQEQSSEIRTEDNTV